MHIHLTQSRGDPGSPVFMMTGVWASPPSRDSFSLLSLCLSLSPHSISTALTLTIAALSASHDAALTHSFSLFWLSSVLLVALSCLAFRFPFPSLCSAISAIFRPGSGNITASISLANHTEIQLRPSR
ncbi:hypothetical protein J3F83DRAFT_475035 [Trichoderma novae-zelandiae]